MEITNTAGATSGVSDAAQESQEQPKGYVPLENLSSTEKDSGKTEGIVNAATGARPELTDSSAEINITDVDKQAFIESVVTGTRFTTTVRLFGGQVSVKFRARSLAETEAILAYMNRNGIEGTFKTRADVQDASLLALLVAQVAELNGVSYDEMKAPLLYKETLDGVQEPAWVQDMEIWRRKPEALVAAIGDGLVEFEAKYWAMTKEAASENFWNPGGSTGK